MFGVRLHVTQEHTSQASNLVSFPSIMWGVLFYCLRINFILLSLQALISLELDPQRAIMRALALAGTRMELMIVSTQTGIEYM